LDLKQRGDDAIENGRYDAALDAYSRALAIEPTPALHYNRGRALQALSRNAEALEEFQEFARTASPDLIAVVPQLPQMIEMTRSRVGFLQIDCPLKNATVTVGTRVWTLPLTTPLRFDPGDYSVEIKAPGYVTQKTPITLRGGDDRTIRGELSKVDLRANLRITSPVPGATVNLDGKRIGTVPADATLAAGPHELTVSHPDYRDATSQVILKERERRELSVALDPKPHFYDRWWFWTALGVMAAGGVALGIALSTEKSASSGDIPPGQITAPLIRY
jgi:tetratricopeptide (TPR) repeat protein